MRKVINIKPAEEILLIDPENSKEYIGIFNMKSLFIFQNKLVELGVNKNNLKDCDLMTICLYSVLNSCNEMEYDEVEKLSVKVGSAAGKEIINMFMEMLFDSMSKEEKELVKKTMAQYLIQVKK